MAFSENGKLDKSLLVMLVAISEAIPKMEDFCGGHHPGTQGSNAVLA